MGINCIQCAIDQLDYYCIAIDNRVSETSTSSTVVLEREVRLDGEYLRRSIE